MLVIGIVLVACLLPTASAQRIEKIYASPDKRLPNGKSRTMAVIKSDAEKSKRDIAETIKLAEELQKQLEEGSEFTIDLRSVRKAEKIERLGRKIKKRFIRLAPP